MGSQLGTTPVVVSEVVELEVEVASVVTPTEVDEFVEPGPVVVSFVPCDVPVPPSVPASTGR
jgi:hypothetical protein